MAPNGQKEILSPKESELLVPHSSALINCCPSEDILTSFNDSTALSVIIIEIIIHLL